jgi:hypothetical protein
MGEADGTIEGSASISYVLSADEAFRWVRARRPWVYRLMALPPIVASAMGLLVLAVPSYQALAILLFGLAAVFVGQVVWMVRITPRRAARRSPDAFRQEVTLTLDAAGVHTRRGAISADVRWDGVDRWTDDGRFVTLWSGAVGLAIVPIRAFANSAAREHFMAVLRSHARGQVPRRQWKPGPPHLDPE